jgi:undecaprenyl-diphosphatase
VKHYKDYIPATFLEFLKEQWTKGRAFILIGFVCASSAFIFIQTASEVAEGETLTVDNAILKGLRQPNNPEEPIGPPWMLEVAQDVTALGGMAVITLVTAAVIGFLAIINKWRTIVFVLASVGGGTTCMLLLKHFFARPRPDIVEHLAPIMHASFPSGHSMLSAIVYLTLGAMLAGTTTRKRLKIYYFLVGATFTVLIGLSRVYLGVHYPTDVLGGWCAGIAWSAMSYFIAFWLQRNKSIEAANNDGP